MKFTKCAFASAVFSRALFASAVLIGIAAPLVSFAAPSASFKGEVDYSVPVPSADLKPFAKFFVSRFEVFQDPDSGSFSLKLTLPRDLVAGKSITVQLVEKGRQGNEISFTRDIGEAVCKVPADWDTAECTYKFNDKLREEFSSSEARTYLGQKYRGDANLAKREKVAIGLFRETESVGIAGLRSVNASCPACTIGNGVWTTTYTNGNNPIDAELSLERTGGHYFTSSGFGDLKSIRDQGNTATGTWTYGSSVGWFQFLFDPESETFDGTWGTGAQGSPALGTWVGSRLQD